MANVLGWSTSRKLLVIEVDDYGAVRLRSRAARDRLIKKGHNLKPNRFDYYDTLESSEDLKNLFEVLNSVKDSHGNPAIVTAVSVVANPDFSIIKNNGFNNYYYKPLIETYNEYFAGNDIMALWQEGIRNKLIRPEFHGREHLNPDLWLKALNLGDNSLLDAFNEQSMVGNSKILLHYKGGHFFAYDYEYEDDLIKQKESITDGLNLFQNIFGYRAKHFTSSGLIHSPIIEPYLRNEGITSIDVAKKHFEPKGEGVYKRRFYTLGKRNNSRQIYITRNARFEPNDKGKVDWVSSTLKDIEIAFRWNKPAIISSHRVNFAGQIDPANRENGLVLLKSLLNRIVKKWPDVEFLSVSELGSLIAS